MCVCVRAFVRACVRVCFVCVYLCVCVCVWGGGASVCACYDWMLQLSFIAKDKLFYCGVYFNTKWLLQIESTDYFPFSL